MKRKKIRNDELKDKEKAIIDIYFSNSTHSLLITCPVSCSVVFLSSMWIALKSLSQLGSPPAYDPRQTSWTHFSGAYI